MIYTYVCTYNRKKISEYCLKSLWDNRQDSYITIDDDNSDRGMIDIILKYSDKAIFNHKHLGIDELRYLQLEYFCKTANDDDLLYLTDNDCFHDIEYIDKLKYFANKYRKKAISIYNSTSLYYCHTSETEEVFFANRISGCSMLLDKELACFILSAGFVGEDWDIRVCKILSDNGKKCVVSKVSYVEHLGKGGIHSVDFNNDRALNPTGYLREKRKEFLTFFN